MGDGDAAKDSDDSRSASTCLDTEGVKREGEVDTSCTQPTPWRRQEGQSFPGVQPQTEKLLSRVGAPVTLDNPHAPWLGEGKQTYVAKASVDEAYASKSATRS